MVEMNRRIPSWRRGSPALRYLYSLNAWNALWSCHDGVSVAWTVIVLLTLNGGVFVLHKSAKSLPCSWRHTATYTPQPGEMVFGDWEL